MLYGIEQSYKQNHNTIIIHRRRRRRQCHHHHHHSWLALQVCVAPATAAAVEFYLYPTVSTALIHSVKPELTE